MFLITLTNIKLLHLILSSNFESEKITSPLNSSKASISSVPSVSHMLKDSLSTAKISSKSDKSNVKLSQIDLNEPWYSLSFDSETRMGGIIKQFEVKL